LIAVLRFVGKKSVREQRRRNCLHQLKLSPRLPPTGEEAEEVEVQEASVAAADMAHNKAMEMEATKAVRKAAHQAITALSQSLRRGHRQASAANAARTERTRKGKLAPR
jgi:hypothetical protein